MRDSRIDGGKPFDWGRVSAEYGKYRDIYPQEFYDRILARGIGGPGQRILDLGTGTGVLPRNLRRYGADWVGIDRSEEQVREARRLSEGMGIVYQALPAEALSFPDGSFDGITACQCFWYFEHEKLSPALFRLLKAGGKVLVLSMAWLPFEDPIAGKSEELVLKYSPNWSGAGETVHPIAIPEIYQEHFSLTFHEEFRLSVPFTRESWNGRMKACRGVGASLSEKELEQWEKEHRELLWRIAPEKFTVLHYGAVAELTVKKEELYVPGDKAGAGGVAEAAPSEKAPE